MKRGRFDSDYDRVRRAPPSQAEVEFPDPSLFDRERTERRAAEQADFRRRMALLGEQEAERAAERRRIADQRTQLSNERALLAEYRRAGAAPPFVKADGITPSCSLSLLLQNGWSLERIGDRVSLLKPHGISHERSQQRSAPGHDRGQKRSAETDPPF